MSQENLPILPAAGAGSETQPPSNAEVKDPCPYCLSSKKHALRHNPGRDVGYVKCLPHRLLQPVTQYMAEFAREATESSNEEYFGQNPSTLEWKAKQVVFAPYCQAPPACTLWGDVIGYIPVRVENAKGWMFYVLLSADFEHGEYNNRKLGVAFLTPAGQWGYLPDPGVALALASCVGWRNMCGYDTCTNSFLMSEEARNAPSTPLPELDSLYSQREDCEECK